MHLGKWFGRGATAMLLLAAPLQADDAATRERIERLERQQEQMNDELRQLRRQLDHPQAENPRVEEVERRQGILTDEVRRLREALVLPETAELKSRYGLGPAASKVYGIERGLSIGGYGETNFRAVIADRHGAHDEFDFARFVLYVGYKFNDWIVLNSEIEFENATTESTASAAGGSVSVEFATLDFLLHPAANVRAGLVLVPMGLINEIHEPPFYHGNVRPPVETQIIPATWSANGFGLFGAPLPGLEYRTYGLSGLNAKGFESSDIREGRQGGNQERADDFAWVARVDDTPCAGALFGGAAFLGNSGQNQEFAGRRAGAFTQIYELHAQLRRRGLEVRALGALSHIGDAAALSADPDINQTIARVMLGYYGEVAYDVLPLLYSDTTQYLAPWFRYSRVDTQHAVPSGFRPDRTQDRDTYEFGLTYKPIAQLALKLDYHIQDARSGTLPDELRLGGGFVF